MSSRVPEPSIPQLDDDTVGTLTMWGKFFLTMVAALGVMGTVAVTQLDLARAHDVNQAVQPVRERVQDLEEWRNQQRIINRCLIWDVGPETCERELGEPLPRPGDSR